MLCHLQMRLYITHPTPHLSVWGQCIPACLINLKGFQISPYLIMPAKPSPILGLAFKVDSHSNSNCLGRQSSLILATWPNQHSLLDEIISVEGTGKPVLLLTSFAKLLRYPKVFLRNNGKMSLKHITSSASQAKFPQHITEHLMLQLGRPYIW